MMQIKTQTALFLGFCDNFIMPFTGFVLFFTHQKGLSGFKNWITNFGK